MSSLSSLRSRWIRGAAFEMQTRSMYWIAAKRTPKTMTPYRVRLGSTGGASIRSDLEHHLDGRSRILGHLEEAGLPVGERPRLGPGAQIELPRLDQLERGLEVARGIAERREHRLLVADHLDPRQTGLHLRHADEEDAAAAAAEIHRLAAGLLDPRGFDHELGAASAPLAHGQDGIARRARHDEIRPELPGDLEAAFVLVDDADPGNAAELRHREGQDADRAGAHDGERIGHFGH